MMMTMLTTPMKTNYLALLTLLQLSLGAGTDAAMVVDDTIYVQQPPVFIHENSHDFRCPLITEYTNSPAIRRIVLTRQIKPAMVIPITDPLFNETTDEHVFQLCYNHGRLQKKALSVDITLVAMGTVDRLENIPFHAQNWDGLMQFAFYIRNEEDLKKIDDMLQDHAAIRERATIHLVFARPATPFPFNMLRNVAQIGIETTHMFLNDIDFLPLPGTRQSILKYDRLLRQQMSGELRKMLVIPAFQLDMKVTEEDGKVWEDVYYKATVEQIKEKYTAGQLKVFDYYCVECHYPSDYKTWMTATKPYAIPGPAWNGSIPEKYEPYIVVPTFISPPNTGVRMHFPYFDEIFADFGRDKIIQMKLARQALGLGFVILPGVALYHRRHPYTPIAYNWRKKPETRWLRSAQYDKRVLWWQTHLDPSVESSLALWNETREFDSDRKFSPIEKIVTINRWATGDATILEWLELQKLPDLFPITPPVLPLDPRFSSGSAALSSASYGQDVVVVVAHMFLVASTVVGLFMLLKKTKLIRRLAPAKGVALKP